MTDLENEILGYTVKPDSSYDSIINWVDQRYGWKVSREMMNFTPGIVPGLAMLIQSLDSPSEQGDGATPGVSSVFSDHTA